MKQATKKVVSAIVPVFNEGKTVGAVIQSLLENPHISEIICVNDGSTDYTLKKLEAFQSKITVINFKKNKGKSHAVATGIMKAKGEIIAFFDGDLIGLSQQHIDNMLQPILNGKKRAVIAFPTPTKHNVFYNLFRNITGERAYYKKDLLPYLSIIRKKQYGLETYLNTLFKKDSVSVFPLIGVKHVNKYVKHKPKTAIREMIKEGVEVTQEFGKTELKKSVDMVKTAQKKIARRTKAKSIVSLAKTIAQLEYILLAILLCTAAFGFTWQPKVFETNAAKKMAVLRISNDLQTLLKQQIAALSKITPATIHRNSNATFLITQ
ncbi:MAG: glycosyltransferase family 2 protein [Candidatus Levybacteria bacterium]|nr:glycosyltransferase family 2 protein [Candidatus Levybacteria bacterium]